MVVVLLVALLHSLTVRASGNFQVVVTCLKVCLVVAFIIIGIWKETAHPVSFAPKPGDFALMVSTPFAISLMFVLYAYTGWNAAAYILSEVRRPEVTVPWALLIGTVIVTVLYVSLNAVFLAAAPLQDYVDKIEVGKIAAEHLLGDAGGRIMSGLISLGLISAISAMTWAGATRRASHRTRSSRAQDPLRHPVGWSSAPGARAANIHRRDPASFRDI